VFITCYAGLNHSLAGSRIQTIVPSKPLMKLEFTVMECIGNFIEKCAFSIIKAIVFSQYNKAVYFWDFFLFCTKNDLMCLLWYKINVHILFECKLWNISSCNWCVPGQENSPQFFFSLLKNLLLLHVILN